jgi:hypothetical protein
MIDGHLSRAELTTWRDDGLGDRAQIAAHLAACAECRQIAAAIERQRLDPGATSFDAGSFVERGYRAGGTPIGLRIAYRWWVPAAAAALLAIAVMPWWWARSGDRPGAIRGTSAIALVRPVEGSVSAADLVFEWTGTAATDRVRLNVVRLERPGEPLIEREVVGSRYEPTPDERRGFQSGASLHWYVERLSGAGGETSPSAEFRVR